MPKPAAKTNVTPLKQTIQTEMVKVDSETAQSWLDTCNTHNRKIREAHVLTMARDMNKGRWSFNGAPIVFGTDGTLLDGQHRLAAVVKSKSAIPFLILRGVSEDAQHTMDTGARRTAADAWELAGRDNNARRITAVARFALIVDDKVDNEKVSTAEIFDFVDQNPLIVQAVDRAGANFKSSGMTPRVYDYCLWRLSEVDQEAALEFFRSLHSLTDLPEGSPITALHRRLMAGNYTSRRQLDAEATVSLVFRAWNAWREGRPVTKLYAVGRTGNKVNIPVPA